MSTKARRPMRFGRCEDWEQAECGTCSDAGRDLCAILRTVSFRSPRKGPKSEDKRKYAAVVNDVLRLGCLGSSVEGAVLTYLHLVSWASAHSDLVYLRKAKELAFARGISKDAFLRHVSSLEALQLLKRVQRIDVMRTAGLQEHAYFLMPIPKTIRILVRLHEDVAAARSFAEYDSAVAAALAARRELLERYAARLRGDGGVPDEDEVFADYGPDPDPVESEEDEPSPFDDEVLDVDEDDDAD